MTRLILIIILFLVSLLAVFKAFAYPLWLLAIGVTEFPWLFSGITILILLTGFWVGKYQVTGTVIGAVALILFLSPIFRAWLVSSKLNNEFDKAFAIKATDDEHAPFHFFRMFKPKDTVGYKTLTYVHYSDTSLTLDYYPAKQAGNKPCVVVVHGGSWSSGDSRQLPELNSYLALRGYNVASINYRMAPKWQTPAPVEDIVNALKYLRSQASELHIDTNKFVLLGRSAGSQIAMLAAYTLHDKSIVSAIDFYGPIDMVWGYSIPSNPLIMDSRKVMGDYVGGTYKQVPQKYHDCSPLEFVDKNSPTTLIIHGSNDVLVSPEHSRRLNAKLEKNGIKHFYLKLPWATHGFDYNLNGPGGQLSTYTVLRFLNLTTK
jgi:acetyl esterase/lipase